MTVSEAKRQTRLAEWRKNIREQQNSGLSIKGWCARNGLSEPRYYYWLKLVREETISTVLQNHAEAALVRIEPDRMPVSPAIMPTATPSSHPGIVVRYGGAAIEFPVGTQAAEIAPLLKALNGL
jgi:hypothetical protein